MLKLCKKETRSKRVKQGLGTKEPPHRCEGTPAASGHDQDGEDNNVPRVPEDGGDIPAHLKG
jgi:hypothetical protein